MWGQVVRWFVMLAPGYFFNDIADVVSGWFKVEKNSDGKYPVWFPLALIAGFALVIVFVVGKLFGRGKKGLFGMVALFALGAQVVSRYYFGNDFEVIGMVLLATLTTGAAVVTTVNTTYVPKYLFYVAATQLTGLRVTVQGDGIICDLDAAGLNALRAQRLIGAVTNGTMIELCNGFIQGKNVIWEFTNSAAQTPQVFVGSQETQPDKEKLYLTSLRQAILANSGTDFADFAVLGLPALAAADVINALYRDGTQQQFNRADLQAMTQYTQTQVNTPDYSIDNFAMKVKKVNVVAAAAQTAYVQRWTRVAGLQMIEQQVNAQY